MDTGDRCRCKLYPQCSGVIANELLLCEPCTEARLEGNAEHEARQDIDDYLVLPSRETIDMDTARSRELAILKMRLNTLFGKWALAPLTRSVMPDHRE